ncbi:MAG TPA: CvpA family protein [Stellaceae bacterium]|nr:CvpA family protein [Stellaceae bacterium]
MNPLDIGVIAVIGLSAVFAFARGFVREALSIAAWVGAGFITLYGHDYLIAIVEPMVHNQLLSQLIAWGGLFIGSLIALTILTGFIARAVRAGSLSSIDRTLGFVFGILRGAFIVCLAFLALEIMVPQESERPQWLRDAKSAPYLQEGAKMLSVVLPAQWREKTSTAAEELIQKTKSQTSDDLTKAAIRALSNPTAPTPTGTEPAPPPTYKPGDQKTLDRIINNNNR